MPGYVLDVPGTATIYATFPGSIPKPCAEDTSLWRTYYSREERAESTRCGWDHGVRGGWWPSSSGFLTDPATPTCLMMDQDIGTGSPFCYEPWTQGIAGCQSTKSIRGTCKRSTGEPLGGSIVKGFRTSDNLPVGQTTCDDQGHYELACPNTPTDQHYLMAYYASGNLAGTTVNTLVPTWRDGTT
jgi:hypothetical protein